MSTRTEPSISIREWIRWLPDTASEPTSTLVLTSSSHRFVDIRISLPTERDEPTLPNEGGPMHRLEWGFAGQSSSRLLPAPPTAPPGTPPTLHSQWQHWVDSKTDAPVTDAGVMYPQADGAHTLEKGRMENPATGAMGEYEELWVDGQVQVVPDSVTGSSEGAEGVEGGAPEGDGRRWSIVLELSDEAHGAKGMVVRVGQWCQGIIKVRGEVAVERWQWSAEHTPTGDEGDWKRVARLGRLFLPCARAFDAGGVMEGSKVKYGDYEWTVSEVFSW